MGTTFISTHLFQFKIFLIEYKMHHDFDIFCGFQIVRVSMYHSCIIISRQVFCPYLLKTRFTHQQILPLTK